MMHSRPITALVAALSVLLLAGGCADGSGSSPSSRPAIASLDPAQGDIGQAVTITGSSFESSPSLNMVFFGQTQAYVASSTTTEIVCEVPAGLAAGDVSVTVSTRAGTSSAASFTVVAGAGGPSLTRLDPTAGPVGTAVVISGSGFATSPGGNQVTFNGVPAPVHAATATRIDTSVPAGASSGAVVVRTDTGTSNGVTFTVTTSQPADQGPSGSKARDFLAPSPYTSMLVEVGYVVGSEPAQAALDLLAQRLQQRCDKPGGIQVTLGAPISSGRSTWSVADLRAAEQAHRQHYHSGSTAVLYVLYVDGQYAANAGVLGVSYSGTAVAIFKDQVRVTSGPPNLRTSVEEAVLVHEAGHALGLVNHGIPMDEPHEDPSNHGHCDNSNCVMYWAVNSSLAPGLLGSLPDQFDAHCIADMRMAGGR